MRRLHAKSPPLARSPRSGLPRPGSWPVQLAPHTGEHPQELPHGLLPSLMEDELSRALPGRSSALLLAIAERHLQAHCLTPPRRAPVAHTRSQPSTEAPRALHHSSRPHDRRQFEPRRAFRPAPPPSIGSTSFDPSNHRKRTLGEQGPFPYPFPAKPGLLVDGSKPCTSSPQAYG
jgi:hypothetical protein